MFVRPSVCLSVSVSVRPCLSRSPDLRLFGQLERRNCRENEKKREKSSENEETVEKSREKWFGHGSIPSPSDYRDLTWGPIYWTLYTEGTKGPPRPAGVI